MPNDQSEWSDLLATEQWVQALRPDVRKRLMQLAECLRNWADWSTFECSPTWPKLCAVSGWARSTMASWIRRLRVHGWLVVVEQGSTPRYRRPGRPEGVKGNRAAVYGLRVPETARKEAEPTPPPDETWTPSWFLDLIKGKDPWGGSTRARDFIHRSRNETNPNESTQFYFSTKTPASSTDMLVAAHELRRQHPVLAPLSGQSVRSLARPHWQAGADNTEVLHRLSHRPTGSPLPSANYAIMHPLSWCQSRLQAWITDDNRAIKAPKWVREQHEAQQQHLISQYGRIGERLLRHGGELFEHVVEYGRKCAR